MLTGIRPQESVRRLICDEVRPLTKFCKICLPDHKKHAIMKASRILTVGAVLLGVVFAAGIVIQRIRIWNAHLFMSEKG